jgi:hypothetical protein
MRRWRPEIGRSSSSFVAALLGPFCFSRAETKRHEWHAKALLEPQGTLIVVLKWS